ncbi:MAG: hypothetical protein ABJH68_18085, partial [Ilumatobacter sp.]|uniref:hypothetical protein n=1 Tax=Ilumatobacter sp. TaxID=1967498 RepID=UPI0032984315
MERKIRMRTPRLASIDVAPHGIDPGSPVSELWSDESRSPIGLQPPASEQESSAGAVENEADRFVW